MNSNINEIWSGMNHSGGKFRLINTISFIWIEGFSVYFKGDGSYLLMVNAVLSFSFMSHSVPSHYSPLCFPALPSLCWRHVSLRFSTLHQLVTPLPLNWLKLTFGGTRYKFYKLVQNSLSSMKNDFIFWLKFSFITVSSFVSCWSFCFQSTTSPLWLLLI